MWVRCYKTPEIRSIGTGGIPQPESDTVMQKGYYYSREHTFVRAGSSGEDSNPLSATSHDVAESLKGIFSAPRSAPPLHRRSGKGADSTITYSHMWCMVLNPAIYGMGAWWFERSLWLMTLLTVDRKVLCKAGEQAGGPDRCSPAPLLNVAFGKSFLLCSSCFSV